MRAFAALSRLAVATLSLIPAGCQQLEGMLDDHGGVVSDLTGVDREVVDDVNKGVKTANVIAEAAEGIDPSQEYYLGRAVGATILEKYPPYDNEEANRYVGELGQSLAWFSEVAPYRGYHFLILDTDVVNAYAAPGAYIFLTRGGLRLCETEDELAAMLAHEIAHVQCRHAVRSIDKSRWTKVATLIAQEAAKEAGSRNVVQLTEAFGGILDDFVTAIVESGYSREYEEEADEAAVGLLRRSGYDPRALVTVLRKLEKRQASSSGDLFSTHPAVKDRIGRIAPLAGAGSAETVSARQQRFEAATARARSPQS